MTKHIIDSVKNYFNNLNKFSFTVGIILFVTGILSYIGGAGLTIIATSSLFIFAGIFIYNFYYQSNFEKNFDKKIFIPFCLILLSIIFSFFWVDNYYLTVRFLAGFLIFGGIVFAVKRIKPSSVILFLSTLSLMNFGLAIWDIFNYPTGGVIRLAGFVGYVNTLGLYSVVFGFIALSYINSYVNKLENKINTKLNTKLNWFLIIIASINFFVAFMTLSRGTGVAVIVSVIITTLFFYKRINPKNVFKYGLITISVALILTGSVYLIKKYATNNQISFSRSDITVTETSGLRLQYFKTATDVFKQNKFGIGPGNYREGMFKYLKNPIEQANDPHSFPMMLLAENGVFIILWLYLLFEIVRNVINNKNNFNQKHIFYIFISLAFFLHSLFDADMSYPFSWIILGFLLGNTLTLKEFSPKFFDQIKNTTVSLMLILGFMGLASGYLIIDKLEFIGSYEELESRDKSVLLAAQISPINGSLWQSAALMSFYKMLNAQNETDMQKSAEEVFYRTGRSMALRGQYASQYSLRARAYSILRDEANYRTSLEKSVSLSSFNTYSERKALAYYYKDHNLYPELKNLVLSTYDLNSSYFGTVYSKSDLDLETKTESMISMLRLLQMEAFKNKDKDTEKKVENILNTFK